MSKHFIFAKVKQLMARTKTLTEGFSVGLKPGRGSLGLVESGKARGPLFQIVNAFFAKQLEPRLQVSACWGTGATTACNRYSFLRGGYGGKGKAISSEVVLSLRFMHVISILMLMACFLSDRPVLANLENGMSADIVLGQASFTNSVNGGSGSRLIDGPIMAVPSQGKLLVSGDQNNRILIYNSIPRSSFAPADLVIGQPDLASGTANNGGLSARSLFGARLHQVTSEGKLLVSDHDNNRILIWNSIPTQNFQPADLVLLQPDFTSNGANVTRTIGNNPHAVFFDGTYFWVSDRSNSRILMWRSFPTQNGQPADLVLGQPDFVSNTANNGGLSARALNQPRGVWSDGKVLFIADRNNHRILIWKTIPTRNFQPADFVLGQPDFVSNAVNNGGVSARSISNPWNIRSDGKRMMITGNGNHRILIWNSLPIGNNIPADFVIGQPNFSSNAAGIGPNRLNSPLDVTFDARRIFVSDFNNDRVLIFNIADSTFDDLGPQFSQGKAVVGKVFWDFDGDGRQDA